MINELMSFLNDGDTNALQSVRIALVYCQIGVYLFFAFAIYSVWKHHTKSVEDRGFLFISLFFVFSLILSVINLLDDNFKPCFPNCPKSGELKDEYMALVIFLQTTFSSLNSGFLFASFPYFKIVKKEKIINDKTWIDKIFIFLLVVSVTTPILWYVFHESTNVILLKLHKIPDIFASLSLFGLLGYILYKQFDDRRAKRLAIISTMVCVTIVMLQICLLFFVEYPKEQPSADVVQFYGQRIIFNFLNLLTNSALGTIFLALAYTWVFEEFDIEERSKETIQRDNDIAEVKRQLEISQAEIVTLRQKIDDTPLVSEVLAEAIPKSVTIQAAFSKSELKEKLLKGEFRKPDALKVRLNFGAYFEEFDATDLGITKTGFLAFALSHPVGIADDKVLKLASKGITGGSEMVVSKWTNYIQDNFKKRTIGLNGKKLKMFEDIGKGEYKLIPLPEWEILNSK